MNKLALLVLMGLFSMGSAYAAAYKGVDGKTHFTGSFGMGHGPVRITREADHRAAKRMCLMHIDKFVAKVKANEEDHVRLANHCSRGHFNTIWRLTGGSVEKSVIHKGEAVDEWEKAARDAGENLGIHPIDHVPSQSWRNHLEKLSKKVK